MTLLFDNHRQTLKVRCLMWGIFAAGLSALYAGWSIFQTLGLAPGDGGVLRPVGERLAFGAGVALLGIAGIAGMMLFASLYAVTLSRQGERIEIETLTLSGIGRRHFSFDVSEVGEAAYHHGRMKRGIATDEDVAMYDGIDAPWITMRVAGRRLPFILDLQAEIIEIVPLTLLAEGAVTDWQNDPG